MSGSIDSESDACGNDWDESWKPPSSSGDGATAKGILFTWKCPWKKVDVFLIDSQGQKNVISNDAAFSQPIKLQFLLSNRLDNLDTIIRNIPTLDIKSLKSGIELLEIAAKSDVHLGNLTEIGTVLSNEMEDVFLKMIPRLPFTCKVAEDLFFGYIKEDKMTMYRDDTRVYIVGPSSWKELICNTIDQLNSLVSTDTVLFKQKWKSLALDNFKVVSTVSQMFPDVSITTNTDLSKAVFRGRKDDVQKATTELDRQISGLCVENLIVDPIILRLLQCEEASKLLSTILKKKGLGVTWTVEDFHLCVVDQQKIDRSELRFILSEHFIYAGLSNVFTKSKLFLDSIKDHRDKLLVMDCGNTSCTVASTKKIIRRLLHQEYYYSETESKEIQVALTVPSLPGNIRRTDVKSLEHGQKFITQEGLAVFVYVGHILKLNVDYIVSASNERLLHDGGLACVISTAAGITFQQESADYVKRYGCLAVTECCTTSAGTLPYKGVIHAVGPKWNDYRDKNQCEKSLFQTILNCLHEAEKKNVKAIAIPAISSGIFGVPKNICCTEYANAVKDFSRRNRQTSCIKEIHFIDKDLSMVTLIQTEFRQKFNISM